MKKRGPFKKADRATIPPKVLQPSIVRRRRSVRSVVIPFLGLVALLALGLALVGTLGSSNKGGKEAHHQGKSAKSSATTTGGGTSAAFPGEPPSGQGSRVSLGLRATATVWVCLVDQRGRTLVNGETLSAGEARGPFDSRGLEVTFGNGSVQMTVDGESAKVPPVAQPVGYRITPGSVRKLKPASQPTCQ
jgi:uncharacterized protein DUF4115